MLYAYLTPGMVEFDDVVVKQDRPGHGQQQVKVRRHSPETKITIKEMEENERRSREAEGQAGHEAERPRSNRTHAALSLRHGDFGISPLMFYYEVTLACDLVCKHCRASAQEKPIPASCRTAQAKALIDQVAGFPRPPMLVLTGGDPLKRPDLFELIRHAVAPGCSRR